MGNCWRVRRRDASSTAEDRSPVAIGQNKPLHTAPEEWSTDMPITERQLKIKRDTFWETAPAYDGRCEIWDALKAACAAAEEDDYSLAQAIIDGANITLPTGRLVEAYDELGNRYVIPKYCISRPTNMIRAGGSMRAAPEPSSSALSSGPQQLSEEEQEEAVDSSTRLLQGYTPLSRSLPTSLQSLQRRTRTNSDGSRSKKRSKSKRASEQGEEFNHCRVPVVPTGDPIMIKIRVSTLSNDIKMTIQAADKVRDVKRRLEVEHGIPAQHVTMLYSGRVLRDGVYLKPLDIPKGFIIQAIVT